MTQHTTDEAIAGIDMNGKTVVVTGATAGLGLETARALAAAGARVVLAGRGETRRSVAVNAIAAAVPGADLETVELDLASLASVRAAAAELRDRLERIDVLINNAGVMFTPLTRTADGFEMQFGTNHLGHFAWTNLLEPLLLAGAPARVVNLSSAGHRIADIDLEDPNWESRPYNKFDAYGAAKTANILFTVELDRSLRDRGVRSFAVHPGNVQTDLVRHMDRADLKEMAAMAGRAGKSDKSDASGTSDSAPSTPPRLPFVQVDRGAATSVWAATSPTLADVGGLYLADCAISDQREDYSVDPARALRLWELSEQLTQPTAH